MSVAYQAVGWTAHKKLYDRLILAGIGLYLAREVVAVHGGRLSVGNLRGILRYLAKHRGERYADRARVLLLWSLRVRGLAFRGERGARYREGARFLASGDVGALLA